MAHPSRTSPRIEHLQQEHLRVQQSPTLLEKFPELKSITVDLAHYDPDGFTRNSQIKYTVNVAHAKSVFCVGCHNQECVRGGFDLSTALATAVAEGRSSASGEICCPGWRNRATIDTNPCGNILRYQLSLGYGSDD